MKTGLEFSTVNLSDYCYNIPEVHPVALVPEVHPVAGLIVGLGGVQAEAAVDGCNKVVLYEV